MDELLLNAGIQDPAKRAKFGATMTNLMQDMAKRAVLQSDQAWEARIPQLVATIKQDVIAEIDAKLSARDEQVEKKFAALQEQIGVSTGADGSDRQKHISVLKAEVEGHRAS